MSDENIPPTKQGRKQSRTQQQRRRKQKQRGKKYSPHRGGKSRKKHTQKFRRAAKIESRNIDLHRERECHAQSWIDVALWASVYQDKLIGKETFTSRNAESLLGEEAPSSVVGPSSCAKWCREKLLSIVPSENLNIKRKSAYDAVSKLIRARIQGAEVGIFGSAAAGVDIFESDVDVIIFFRGALHAIDVRAVLSDVHEGMLTECNRPDSCLKGTCTYIASSRIPVIKLETEVGVSIDVSCQNPWTLVGVRFVRHFLRERCPLLASLVRLVKHWRSSRKIRPSRYGGLSSWGWTLMVVFAYQQNPTAFDALSAKGDLVSMLSEFFRLYATSISLRQPSVLSVRTGSLVPRKYFVDVMVAPSMRHMWHRTDSFLSIEEPVVRPPVDIASHIGDDVWCDMENEISRGHLLLKQQPRRGDLELLFSSKEDRSQAISRLCEAASEEDDDVAKTLTRERDVTPVAGVTKKEDTLTERAQACFLILVRKDLAKYAASEAIEIAISKNGGDEGAFAVCLAAIVDDVDATSSVRGHISETKGRSSPLVPTKFERRRVRLLACSDAPGQRPLDSPTRRSGNTTVRTSNHRMHRFRHTNIVLSVASTRILAGVKLFAQTLRGPVTGPWAQLCLDPADAQDFRKIHRALLLRERIYSRRRESSKRGKSMISEVASLASSKMATVSAASSLARAKRSDPRSLAAEEDIVDFVSPLKRRRSQSKSDA